MLKKKKSKVKKKPEIALNRAICFTANKFIVKKLAAIMKEKNIRSQSEAVRRCIEAF